MVIALDLVIALQSNRAREAQIILDIRPSRGRDNIKNYGEEKNFKKKFGFSCFKASEDMISSLFFMIRKPIDLLKDKALHSVKKRLHLLSQTDMSLCDFSFPRV